MIEGPITDYLTFHFQDDGTGTAVLVPLLIMDGSQGTNPVVSEIMLTEEWVLAVGQGIANAYNTLGASNCTLQWAERRQLDDPPTQTWIPPE